MVLGAHVLRVPEPTQQVFGISAVIRHPDYQPDIHANDICLLLVSWGGPWTLVWPVPGLPYGGPMATFENQPEGSHEHPSQVTSLLCPPCLPHPPRRAPPGCTEQSASQHAQTPGALHRLWLPPGRCSHRHRLALSFPQLSQVCSGIPFSGGPLCKLPLPPPSPHPFPLAHRSWVTASTSRLGGQGFISLVAI